MPSSPPAHDEYVNADNQKSPVTNYANRPTTSDENIFLGRISVSPSPLAPATASTTTSLDFFPPSKKDSGRAWIALVGIALGMFLVSPIVFTFGLYFIELQTAFRVSPSDLATLNGFATGLYLFTGCFTGPVSHIVGHWRIVLAGSLLAVCGAVATYFVQRFALLYITYGLLVGLNLGMCEYALIGVIGVFFDRYASFATLVAFLSFSCGCLALPPLIRLCIAHFHWNGGMLFNAVLILTLACGSLTLRQRGFASHCRRRRRQQPAQHATSAADTVSAVNVPNNNNAHGSLDHDGKVGSEKIKSESWRTIFRRAFSVAMLRDWRFYMVALIVVTATAVLQFGLFVVDFLAHELQLMPADTATLAVTTLYAGEAVGRLAIALITLWGEKQQAQNGKKQNWFSNPRYQHAIMICGTLLLAALFVIFASVVNASLAKSKVYPTVFVLAAAMGLCSSVTWSYIPLLMLELFGGAGNIGTAWGFTQAINGALKFGLDAAAGGIKVHSGTYAWSFRFAGMLLALSAVLMLVVVRTIPPKATVAPPSTAATVGTEIKTDSSLALTN